MRSPEVGVISMAELREIRNQTEQGKKADAAIIKANYLADIRERFIIKTNDDLKREKKMRESEREQRMFAATQRKKKMAEFDDQRATKVQMSDISRENKQQQEGILSKAQYMMDEQLDDVKAMN